MATFGAQVTQSAVIETSDPITMQFQIQRAIAEQLIAHGQSQLVDIYLAGGGAGAVWLVTLLFSTLEAGNFPNLIDQLIFIAWGLEASTIEAQLEAFRVAHPLAVTTFADSAAGGAGASWITVLVYESGAPTPPTGPVLLRELSLPALTAEQAEAFTEPVAVDQEERATANRARIATRLASRKRSST